jgi:ABC-2 type transport system ATP-binding protein
MAGPLLVARGLGKTFGTRMAVSNLSLELHRGETFALVGPNGAGKTTTLRLLAGLIAPSTGDVELDGQPLTASGSAAARRHIGLLTEAPGLWDRLSVRRNLAVYAGLYGLKSPSAVVDASLSRFGVLDRAEDAAGTLSKGLRQRVALARALIHDPSVVLLDEPTAGLDPESARSVRDLVRHLQSEGRAVLICTHNLDEVERVATRVGVLRTRLLAVDTPTALRARFFNARVRVVLADRVASFAALLRSAGVADVGTDGAALSVALDQGPGGPVSTTPDLVRLLVEAGARVESVTHEAPSLEDAYLHLLDEENRA